MGETVREVRCPKCKTALALEQERFLNAHGSPTITNLRGFCATCKRTYNFGKGRE